MSSLKVNSDFRQHEIIFRDDIHNKSHLLQLRDWFKFEFTTIITPPESAALYRTASLHFILVSSRQSVHLPITILIIKTIARSSIAIAQKTPSFTFTPATFLKPPATVENRAKNWNLEAHFHLYRDRDQLESLESDALCVEMALDAKRSIKKKKKRATSPVIVLGRARRK